jgi:hypothetical protein
VSVSTSTEKKVRGGDRTQMRAEERLPPQPLAARGCWLEAVPKEDPHYGVAAHLMAEVTQRADQPRVPQLGFSVAIWTTSWSTSTATVERPGGRRAEPSDLRAISSRYQRRIVSGVTWPASSPSRRRP